MPSLPSAGLLVFRRMPGEAPVEVLLAAPPAGRSRRRSSSRVPGAAALKEERLGDEAAARRGVRLPHGTHRIPGWEYQLSADRATADGPSETGTVDGGTARASGMVAAAELSIEERLRARPRTPKPTNKQLLETARRGFAAGFGLLLEPPFLFLGGVKQHHHRVLYVWGHEVGLADVETIARHLDDPRAARFLDLAEAREVIVGPQRRFIDQLAALLSAQGRSGR